MSNIRIDEKYIGDGHPVFIIAEIGINHQGDINIAKELIEKYRCEIENYIKIHPDFKTSLKSLPLDQNAPSIIKDMMIKSTQAEVGPMASVAGAISEFVGKDLITVDEANVKKLPNSRFVTVKEIVKHLGGKR